MTKWQWAWHILLAIRDFLVIAGFGVSVWFWSTIWAIDMVGKTHLH